MAAAAAASGGVYVKMLLVLQLLVHRV